MNAVVKPTMLGRWTEQVACFRAEPLIQSIQSPHILAECPYRLTTIPTRESRRHDRVMESGESRRHDRVMESGTGSQYLRTNFSLLLGKGRPGQIQNGLVGPYTRIYIYIYRIGCACLRYSSFKVLAFLSNQK